MNAIKSDVIALATKELASANEKFPQFRSAHEGYAVILEEAWETEDAVCDMRKHLDAMWSRVRDNNATSARAALLRQAAINTACEAIQVAAMAQKFIEMEASKCD